MSSFMKGILSLFVWILTPFRAHNGIRATHYFIFKKQVHYILAKSQKEVYFQDLAFKIGAVLQFSQNVFIDLSDFAIFFFIIFCVSIWVLINDIYFFILNRRMVKWGPWRSCKLSCYLMTMRSQVRVWKIVSSRNIGKSNMLILKFKVYHSSPLILLPLSIF